MFNTFMYYFDFVIVLYCATLNIWTMTKASIFSQKIVTLDVITHLRKNYAYSFFPLLTLNDPCRGRVVIVIFRIFKSILLFVN